MKKTTIALGILERELVRQIIKLAAEGPLAQPTPMQPVKPNTAEKVVQPIKPIAQMGKTTGAPAGRSMFDRQGSGDAQARAAIYDKTKQFGAQISGASSRLGDRIGSMLPVGRPGNSGIGNKPMSMADEMRGTFKQMGSDVQQMGTQLNNARLQVGGAIGNYVGSKIPASQPGNSGFGVPPNKPMSMADEMRGTFKQMGSDVQQMGTAITGASSQLGGRIGSMLSPGKPSNSSFGNVPSVNRFGAAPPQGPMGTGVPGPGQNPAAYGAAPPQGPMGTGVPGPGQNPAAYGAAPPQGPMGTGAPATPTIPPFTPSPEMKQFMTDNNMQNAADFGNLTEEQQLQFDDLYEKQQQQPAAPASKPSTYAYGMGPASASAQTAPKTQPAQAQPAAPTPEQQQNVPDSVKAWGGSLPEQATPDQRAQADQAEQQLKAMPPKEQQELATAASDPKSPAAQKKVADGANNYVSQTAADPNNPMPTDDPVAAGNWMSESLDAFKQLPFESQLLIGAGLSVGVVSMLSSLMGGGGMGTMLLGALGLGAAGVVGASTGMLGGDAKGWVNDAFSGLVTAFGGNVPNEGDIRARLEAAAKQGPEAANAELEKVRGEVKPYAGFSQDAGKFITESADPNYLYNQAKGYGRDNYADLAPQNTTYGIPTGAITSAVFGKPTMEDADPNNRTWNEWAWGAPGSAQREKNVETGVQRKGFKEVRSSVAVSVMHKAARCWAGYEPVPGAKAYSEGSCRPKGSKKTKKEVIQGKNHSEKKAGGYGVGLPR